MWWICPPHHCHPFKRLYVPESRGHGLHREGTGAELLQEGRALLVRLKRNRTAIYIFSGVASAPFFKCLQPSPTISNHLQPSPTIAKSSPTIAKSSPTFTSSTLESKPESPQTPALLFLTLIFQHAVTM